MKPKTVLFTMVLLLVGVGVLAMVQPKTLIRSVYGLETLETKALVERFEGDESLRGLVDAQITGSSLTLMDDKHKDEVVDISGERFYLAVAPYINQTHPCTNHIPTGCKGEQINKTFSVRVIGDDGTVYYNDIISTGYNGFMGVWLPRDIKATLTVESEIGVGSVPITTFENSPTCLTSLQLK